MMCQYCNQNEANLSFHFNIMGYAGEMHLCGECAEQLRRYATLMPQGVWPYNEVPFKKPQSQVRELGGDGFPSDAGDNVRRKRELNSLKARLNAAIECEDYEECARLRDKIKKVETEVCSYGI